MYVCVYVCIYVCGNAGGSHCYGKFLYVDIMSFGVSYFGAHNVGGTVVGVRGVCTHNVGALVVSAPAVGAYGVGACDADAHGFGAHGVRACDVSARGYKLFKYERSNVPATYTEKVKIIQAKVYNVNKKYKKSIDNLTLQNMLVQSTFKNFYSLYIISTLLKYRL